MSVAPPLPKSTFIDSLGEALERGEGFAAGKLGVTERALLRFPMVLTQESEPLRIRAFERSLVYKAQGAAGLFPAKPDFYRRFADVFAAAVRSLDYIGLFPEKLPAQLGILRFHGIEGRVMRFQDQEPDRSLPDDPASCYLPHLRGRTVVLVSAFAELLRERANRETFEAVWANTGKPWFGAERVEAVEIPLGWSPETQARYPTSLELLEDITSRLARVDYDFALIGAGGLGIPIASWVKRQGRAALSLGGHVQPLFGVTGARWRADAGWQRYFNDAWVELPERYRPEPGSTHENYW